MIIKITNYYSIKYHQIKHINKFDSKKINFESNDPTTVTDQREGRILLLF
jgi:hypothetical protein